MKKFLLVTIAILVVWFLPTLAGAVAVVEDESKIELAPPLVPDFIEQGAEQQMANWQKIFGEDWPLVTSFVVAVESGDIETIIEEGRDVMMIAPKILPKLGLDLIIPISKDYPGPLTIDPNQEALGIKVGSQSVQVKDIESLDFNSLLLNFVVSGYDVDQVQVKNLINEKSLAIISGEIEARTKLPLKLNHKKLYILDKDKKAHKLKKLPSHATREVQSRYKKFVLEQTTLEIKDDQAMYIVEGQIDGRVLGIFPIKFDVMAEYNAEKGSLDKMNKPWWEVFVF